jgi:hypothetical protein
MLRYILVQVCGECGGVHVEIMHLCRTFRLIYDGNTVIVRTVTEGETNPGPCHLPTYGLQGALRLACDIRFPDDFMAIVTVPLCRTYSDILILPLWSCGPDAGGEARTLCLPLLRYVVPSSELCVVDAVRLVADCKHSLHPCPDHQDLSSVFISQKCLHFHAGPWNQQWLAGECPQDCSCRHLPSTAWTLSYALDIWISFIGEANILSNSSCILYSIFMNISVYEQCWTK